MPQEVDGENYPAPDGRKCPGSPSGDAPIGHTVLTRHGLNECEKGLAAVEIEVGAASHRGRVRQVNEDSHLARGSLAVVADGMGGHASGDVASRLAIAAFDDLADLPVLRTADVHQALREANEHILARGRSERAVAGMGTTLAGLAVVDHGGQRHWLVFNVGDSRVYRFAGDVLTCLTTDHSEVAELQAAGLISAAEARLHPLRSVVTRSLGTDPAPDADTWMFPMADGEEFLVCSDGLTSELLDAEIVSILHQAGSPEQVAQRLVRAAVDAGGRDNVTALIVRPPSQVTDDGCVDTAPRGCLQREFS